MDYDNKGRFGIWRNKDRKEQTHPHLSGSGESLQGEPCWVSAWFSKDLSYGDKQVLADMIKRYEGTSTKPFINISIKLKNQQAPHGESSQGGSYEDGKAEDAVFDDSLTPF